MAIWQLASKRSGYVGMGLCVRVWVRVCAWVRGWVWVWVWVSVCGLYVCVCVFGCVYIRGVYLFVCMRYVYT